MINIISVSLSLNQVYILYIKMETGSAIIIFIFLIGICYIIYMIQYQVNIQN